jgi:hypothetical protein
MRSPGFVALFALILALDSSSAWAFLDPPYIAPANPRAGELISVNIHGGGCDAIVGLPGYPQITMQGNEIRILFFSVHYADLEFCNLGVGTATSRLGAYPPGNYTLRVERRYMTVSGPWALETLGVIPFVVDATPQQAPIEASTLSLSGRSALLLSLIAATLLHLRSK